jgi:hypothetical protein|eukprot:scaffold107_cov269-Chaetoceros_neogracile.AAC.17
MRDLLTGRSARRISKDASAILSPILRNPKVNKSRWFRRREKRRKIPKLLHGITWNEEVLELTIREEYHPCDPMVDLDASQKS